MKNEKKKALYVELSPEDYELLETQLKRRNLDKTNYMVSEDSDIYSECVKLKEGVAEIWRCLS